MVLVFLVFFDVNVDFARVPLHCVNVGSVTDVSEVHASSIFKIESVREHSGSM